MRASARRAAQFGGVSIALVMLLAAALWIFGNTDAGRLLIERVTYSLSAGHVRLTGLRGEFPLAPTLDRLELIDEKGVWLFAERIAVRWSPLALLTRRIQVDELRASLVHMERVPVAGKAGGGGSVPHVEVGRFELDVVELGAPLTGHPAALKAAGTMQMRSLRDAAGELVAHRRDGDGDYALHLRLTPSRVDAALSVHEPASGPLENILSVPGLGALSATVTLAGPRAAERLDAILDAGAMHAEVHGGANFDRGSADLEYTLHSPALQPRPDLGWDRLAVDGTWRGPLSAPVAAATLDADGLTGPAGLRMATLRAKMSGDTGKLSLLAEVDGLQIPGAQPRIFADDPLKFDATLALRASSRPLEVTVTHRLFVLKGRAGTANLASGAFDASLDLRIADLRPFAAFAAQDVQGTASVTGTLAHTPATDTVAAGATLGLTGGTASWLGFVGARPTLKVSAVLAAPSLTIRSLQLDADRTTFLASGTVTRAAVKEMRLRWQLDVADLSRVSPDLAGELKASGQLGGPPDSFGVDAELHSSLSVRGSSPGEVEAHVRARGLPQAPGGNVTAHGVIDGSPLELDAALDRSGSHGYRILVRKADWKSAHAQGEATSDLALSGSQGQLQLRVAQLADLDRVLGIALSGALDATLALTPGADSPEAHLVLAGRGVTLGRYAGDLHLEANGPPSALAVQASAQLPKFYGFPAAVKSTGTLNLDTRQLRLMALDADYRGETARLLAPAILSFSGPVSIDDLKLGVGAAVAELGGQIAPRLDLSASLSQVDADVLNALSPALFAAGALEARARLQGTGSGLTGEARFDATGVQFADDAATGLPPLAVHGRAKFADGAALVDAALDAGPGSQLKVSGSVPLDGSGDLDIKLGGKLDLSLANPFLEARGLHATGAMKLDATVTGGADSPAIGGGIALAGGSLRDYAHGVTLSDIQAQIDGGDGGLTIRSFTAKAAAGSVAVTGSVGVFQDGVPVDLRITAVKAQPIASSILTAVLDADLRIKGTARERLDVGGVINVERATIGIPDSLPPEVAVLDVRRRGQRPTAQSGGRLVVDLDVDLRAPRQILVQGRGLDAELGGDIRIAGTSADPQVSGGFDLQRGSFMIAGNKLVLTPPGRVGFDGAGLRKKIDPTLDFTATSTVSSPTVANATVTLKISGFADAPQFEFQSTPTLPPDEIMALLLFGESASQLTALQAAQIGAALATLSGVGAGNSNPLVKLQRTLGLDRLSVGSNTTTSATGATENSGAAIAAGRYLTKRIYIEGKQTTAGTSQVQVDVDLTKHLKLQTRLGNGTAAVQGTTPENDPGSSVGISYQFEY